MPDRTPYIAANWKMHKTVAEAAEFVDALLPRIAATQSDVVICAPFTALTAVPRRRSTTSASAVKAGQRTTSLCVAAIRGSSTSTKWAASATVLCIFQLAAMYGVLGIAQGLHAG